MSDHCLFVKKLGDNNFIILLLYVDDMLIVDHDASKIDNLKKKLSKSFIIKDQGSTNTFLAWRFPMTEKLASYGYLKQHLLKALLKELTWARQNMFVLHLRAILGLVPSIFLQARKRSSRWKDYFMLQHFADWCTPWLVPIIAHAVGVLSQFLYSTGKEHWTAVKWILRYLRVTSKACLCFNGDKLCYKCTTYMARDVDPRKFLSGYLLTFAGGSLRGFQTSCCFLHHRSRVYCNY